MNSYQLASVLYRVMASKSEPQERQSIASHLYMMLLNIRQVENLTNNIGVEPNASSKEKAESLKAGLELHNSVDSIVKEMEATIRDQFPTYWKEMQENGESA